ncbi:alpha/beta hydrolase [Geodermatophilus nigrescens]
MTEYGTTATGDRIGFDRRGSGPAVVFIAGAGPFRAIDPQTTATAELLAGRGRTTVVHDRVGRGDSWRAGRVDLDDELAAVAALVDAAGNRAVLCGHSSGCAIALRAAAEGLPVDGLVLFEAPLDPRTPGVAEWTASCTASSTPATTPARWTTTCATSRSTCSPACGSPRCGSPSSGTPRACGPTRRRWSGRCPRRTPSCSAVWTCRCCSSSAGTPSTRCRPRPPRWPPRCREPSAPRSTAPSTPGSPGGWPPCSRRSRHPAEAPRAPPCDPGHLH